MNKAVFIICLLGVVFTYFIVFKRDDHSLTLMATTTTQDSGFLSLFVERFEQDSGKNVKVIAYGTGKVLRSAKDGNADIILVHDPLNEAAFIKSGFGKERIPIMRNDFIIIGPTHDPAKIQSSLSAIDAFDRIAATSLFVSRGDESGTHNAEKRIWEKTTTSQNQLAPEKYIVTGSGMGRTLGIAIEKDAYTLTDKATWLSYNNKGNLSILYENDPYFENIYSVISVNPNLFDHISLENQTIFMNWLKSNQAKNTIQNFEISDEKPYLPLLH